MTWKDDEDVFEWEYAVATATKDATHPWQTVTFGDTRPPRCWGDNFYADGSSWRCSADAVTEVGLCDFHFRDITGGTP